MAFPLTLDKYLYAVAKETARLSWPGRMHPILTAGAKYDTEGYFISPGFRTELHEVWVGNVDDYDSWHQKRVVELGESIANRVTLYNAQDACYCSRTVAAKLMNAFMYQLMKYKECRYLWEHLHLVLDGKIFAALRTLARNNIALEPLYDILRKNPYTISLKEYQLVQEHLRKFIEELNSRSNKEFRLTSPIELNLLWADGHKS